MRRIRRRALQALAGIAVLLLLFVVATPIGRYLARAAWEEAKILARRQPIAELVASPETPPELREKLRLVLEARDFAEDSLELNAGRSFTLFSQLESDTLVLVLSAASRDRLARTQWWFPIVGWVPYKGYFDEGRAREAERSMLERGYDTHLRPASAFSTLGWFDDPLVSTTLRADSLQLVDTVIHELLHSTFFAPGQVIFNESFANFVGARGARYFFEVRGDSAAVERIERRWTDQKTLGAFWTQVHHLVDLAYSRHPDDSLARVAARDTVFERMRAHLVQEVGPRLLATDPVMLSRTKFNNALLLARRVYLTDLALFDLVWILEQRDLPRTIKRVTALARSRPDEPYEALREWVSARLSDIPGL